MRTKIPQRNLKGALAALLASSLLAVASSAPAQCPDRSREQFDEMRSPLLPTGWAVSQGVNVTGAPFWVTSAIMSYTAPNDVFSPAPGNLLDNRLDTFVFSADFFSQSITFRNNYNLESGRDGAVLEISSPNINGGAFTDITDAAVGGFISPGYNTVISSSFQSPIAGRMAWSGNSGGYVLTQVFLGIHAIQPPSQVRLRFRLAADNSGASEGWRIDNFVRQSNECPSPTPTATASPTPTATATPIATPCGGPNAIADPTFEAGRPWSNWTVQTSTNFGTPLCDTAACGTVGGSPYAGDNWAWFGGTNVPETATLGQSVPIMAGGTPTLSFVMSKRSISPPFTDVLNVRVDGTIVRSYTEGGQSEAVYSLRTIDLSAFADGGSHLILFEYIGPSTSLGSFLVENVTLTNGAACPTPPPTVTPTPTATATVSTTPPLPSEPPCPSCPPSPTATPTSTPTPTVPPTPTITPTPTATATATIPPTATPTPSDCPPFPPGCTTPSIPPVTTPTPTPTPTLPPTPSPTATPLPNPAQALNISTRLRVEAGDRIGIGGFIITGTVPKKVAIRGLGPSLGSSGLSDLLLDPTLVLGDSNGSFAQNDNWQDDPAQAAELIALGLALQNPNESGIVVTLLPGSYTALLVGKNQTEGLGLVEIYDADRGAASKLANLSTRGFVRTGDSVMIGGFILGHGTADANLVVRGIGPSLSRFMLVDVLADPMLELRDANGALLIANDNWQDDPVMAAQLTGYGLQPTHALEPAIFARLAPGAFTSIVVGKNGGVGIALVELYAVPILVTSTADSGPGSLRDAIAGASDGDTIQFDPALNGQAITLTSGELVIDKSIAIKGFDLYPLPVQRSTAGGISPFRIFRITPGHIVTIQGLAISNGLVTGGPLEHLGGGIYNDGSTLAVAHCVISGNSTGPITGAGGGIGNNADLTISDSTLSGNSAPGGGGGVYNRGAGGHATALLNNTTISGNSSTQGAGILNDGSFGNASLVVNNSTISGNAALHGGGGIINEGPYVGSNASATVSNSTISGNSARIGGAIVNDGRGGRATLEVANSTISDNAAMEQGGSLYNQGGQINNVLLPTVPHSTARTYPVGSTVAAGTPSPEGTATVSIGNTILKTGLSGENIYNNLGEVSSAGYNLSSDNGGGFLTATGDQINTNPMLGPLQDNYGPTFTHALLIGSPAINAGDPAFAPPPLYDQRGPGSNRVISGRIDVGSFEVQQ